MARKPLITPGSLLPTAKDSVPDLMLRVIERDREKSGRRETPTLPFVTEPLPGKPAETVEPTPTPQEEPPTEPAPLVEARSSVFPTRVAESPALENSEYSEHITGNTVIRLPEPGILDGEAIQRIKEKVANRTKAVTFKLDAGLDEYVSDWVSTRWRDRCQKQDVLRRALMLWMYEQETGVRLVDFGDEIPGTE